VEKKGEKENNDELRSKLVP